jgi:cephalosporin-C deacetylase-like acetyl esterase
MSSGWALFLVLCSSLRAAEPACKLSVVTDPPEAIYAVGQPAKFLVALRLGDQPLAGAEVVCVLDKDGMPPAAQKRLKLDRGTAAIEATLAEPGFLRCWVTYVDKDRRATTALAGAAFDPLKIPPSLPVPEDFDAFWRQQKARLAAVPMKPALTAVKSPAGGIECFDVRIPCVPPKAVSGYFARPIGSSPKSLPAILLVHGAGVRSSDLGAAAHSAKRFNALAMDINAHGVSNGNPDAFYQELSDGELKGYPYAGREDRETCYFLGMFLRLARALEFLTAQPQWDGKTLIVRGTSQGGGQAIAAAGLDPRVTFIAAGVPAICDHTGHAIGRANGWPQLVPDRAGKPEPRIFQVARYYDGANFATRSKAEAIFSVGFIDTVCPPTSVYAAYNSLPCKKQMVIEPLMGHAMFPSFERASDAAIAEHIAEKKTSREIRTRDLGG